LEFQRFHLARQLHRIGFDLIGRLRVVFLGRDLQQQSGVGQSAFEPIQTADDGFEFGAFFAKLLGALRVVPDAGLLEFASYFLEPFVLVVVIKDTSSRNPYAPRDL
jgi:hypothetical protein